MKAKELVNILQRYNPDWTRQALLDIIKYVQRIMVEHPTLYSRAVGADGGDPTYEVTDLVDYTLTIDDAFQIEKVYYDGCAPLDVLIQYNTVTFQTLPSSPFRVRYYEKAIKLTSENMELEVPETFVDLLELGCIARIEQQENGLADSWRIWKQRELRRYWGMANRNYRYRKGSTYSKDKLYGE